MIYPQQCIHLLRRILIAAVLVMYQKVVHFLDFPGGLLAEAAYRSSQCKDPNGGTDRHMVILRQVDAQGSNRHRPAVHSIASAPPKAQCSFCAFRGAHFIESGTCPICFFHRLFFLHSPSVKNKPPAVGVRSNVRIIAFLNIKLLLPIKYPCGINKKRRSMHRNFGQHCVLRHTEIKALDERMFVSYTIVVAMLVVKSSFASYRRNSASCDAFY